MKDNPDINIRQANIDDAGAIASILRELGWFAYINEEPHGDTEARVARHMQMCAADDSHSIFVAENSETTVVGYVSVHWLPYMMLSGPEGFISELFIRQAERGKGIGRSLLARVMEKATRHGCVRLHLVTGKERPSYGFYQKLGWTDRPDITDFILPLSQEHIQSPSGPGESQ